MTPLHTYQLCLAISCRVLRGLTKLNGHEKKSWKLPDTLKSSVIFETQIWVIYEKSYLFFPSSQELKYCSHFCLFYLSVVSTRLYGVYRNNPPAKYISRVKNAFTDFFINWLHKERYHRWWFTLYVYWWHLVVCLG